MIRYLSQFRMHRKWQCDDLFSVASIPYSFQSFTFIYWAIDVSNVVGIIFFKVLTYLLVDT